MIPTPETPQAKRALELAIINAFFLPGTAAHFATAFSTGTRKLSASDIHRIWDDAKASGDLPRLERPPGGPRDREIQALENGRRYF